MLIASIGLQFKNKVAKRTPHEYSPALDPFGLFLLAPVVTQAAFINSPPHDRGRRISESKRPEYRDGFATAILDTDTNQFTWILNRYGSYCGEPARCIFTGNTPFPFNHTDLARGRW